MATWSGLNLFGSPSDASPALSARQSPGGYFYFWNLLVPLSVLLNVNHFGLGTHEAGLMLALGIGPHIFEGLVQNTFVLWVVLMFLFIWIEQIMWRWPCYKIYTLCFAKSLLWALTLIAVPSLFIRWVWYPVYKQIPRAVKYVISDLSDPSTKAVSDVILLIASVLLLMHSLHTCKSCEDDDEDECCC